MDTANRSDSRLVQRIVILAAIFALAVVGAYIWGNSLSAETNLAFSQAPQYAGYRDLAAVRVADASASATGSAYAAQVLQQGARGVAAVRAAENVGNNTFGGLQGVAAVRAADEGRSR
jgi:hypothetical protein